jgi:transcriptional regulator
MNLLQGTLDLLVLQALAASEPCHGYQVARWVRETTGGTLKVDDGALYAALHRMARKGWLESSWGLSDKGKRARFYRLTARGRGQLERERSTWKAYAAAMSKAMRSVEAT